MRLLWRLLALSAALALILVVGGVAHAVTIDWVTVGDPGNAADTTGLGSVAYSYQISKYEVTNIQYAEFLNAVDPTGSNALGLYNGDMESSSYGGIRFLSGNPEGSKYVPKLDFGWKPVNYVSFYDALRFANWLNNGQGSGDTETGAYTLDGANPIGVTRNSGATIFLTSEDEWYKAAYYDAIFMSYFEFPAGTDAWTICSSDNAAPNSANCGDAVGGPTDVGIYTFSASPGGTFDQGGNVFEWNETAAEGYRQLRGGMFYGTGPPALAAWMGSFFDPAIEDPGAGFRVAMIPEPSTGLLVMAGMLGLAACRRSRALQPRQRPQPPQRPQADLGE